MHNVLIFGSGRSGTSMVAGTLAKGGYFMGDRLYPGRESNPKGFFEDPEINGINEALLAQVVPKRPRFIGKWFFRNRPMREQRWLARVPVGTELPCPSAIAKRIEKQVQQEPYCFKDPRFCYTLSAWRPFLKNTVFICVFRDPSITVQSILKECKYAAYLRSFSITFAQALEVWTLMYRHILEIHRQEGEWLFLNYNQVLNGEGLDRLKAFTGASVDSSFPDPSLHRTFSNYRVSEEIREVYQQLCKFAEYEDPTTKV